MNSIDGALRAISPERRDPAGEWTGAMAGERAAPATDGAATLGEARASGASQSPPTVFATDAATGGDPLGRAGEAAFLAEVAVHVRAETPFCIGLFGPAGIGKSSVLDGVLASAGRLAASAPSGGTGPFCADVLLVRVDAHAAGGPEALLTDAVTRALQAAHPALAADLHHAGVDPAQAVQESHAALDGVRQRLDVERQALESLTGRDARLVDTVIDAPGSPVDTFARARRSRIERSLRRFGFGGGDPVAVYKDLVREAAEASGSMSRLGLALRALWAYRGQTRLIITALALVVLAWGCAVVRADDAGWIGSLRDLGDRAAPTADWLQAHVHWLGPVQTLLLLAAVLALLLNVLRAARFVLPIARGVDLLQQDLDGRRRDLSGLIAHQTRRVGALSAEAEVAARAVTTAEARVGPRAGGATATAARLPEAPADPAKAFFGALAAAMARPPTAATGPVPGRILVAIDDLDRLPADAAAAVLAAAHRLFGPGIVTIAAADRSHLFAGFGETDPARATAEVERCVQLPYRVGAADASDVMRRAYALALIGGAGEPGGAPKVADPTRSALDAPWRPREQDTVAALSSFAGETPRAIKHFVNLYRVARADPRLVGAPAPVFTALALALALDSHGFAEDLSALDRASHGEAVGDSAILRRALAAARDASGEPVELSQAQRALDVARSYTRRR